ncbi:peptidoglycan/xylan/chitin deacetylase (PgdA/CDA1 family) [Paenibacillus turicensis]|uniref:Peptidoglycan/xylan/chitin deacetylase (PgdA/CDA1 family) n=1 Tax=Paenibacillus turicensis TaxID=160487 RepID=A0ABS4FTV0_9BACL|nr:polysaccharide deacetylase family protein [Paenibacillus turicensis]MBP1906006.1 peptidoglycan/xylan/chitin deacetylase (PgdA/CDA1 family) [Paenibacillus turicensis]
MDKLTKFSVLEQVSTEDKIVAFTFDDGPNPLYTRQLLDIFRAVGGKATFFMLGQQMDASEDAEQVAREAHAAGHEIGNHTYTHPNLATVSLEEAQAEIEKMEQRIVQITGKKPAVFRPPYFGINDEVQQFVGNRGYYTIGAVNNEAQDWEQPGVDFIIDQTKKKLRKGSILIFHDGYGDRSQSIEAVRLLAEELTAEGYQLVTVSELISLATQ